MGMHGLILIILLEAYGLPKANVGAYLVDACHLVHLEGNRALDAPPPSDHARSSA